MTDYRVIGIDQSYTGFGFSVDGEAKKRNFPPGKYDSDVARLVGIREWFRIWLTLQHNRGVDLLVMEGYASNAKFGREMAGELGGAVKMVTYDILGAPPLVVPPPTLKKFVTGSGAGKKNTMLLHVFKKWGEEFSDDNQADAYSLEKFGLAYLDVTDGNSEAHHKYELEAIEAVRHR